MNVLITGATAGLGLAASIELAAAGQHVILGCRNPQRGEAAAAAIRERVPQAEPEVLNLDVADLGSVRTAAAELAGRPLHGLICNAGIQVVDGVRFSPDGHELTFATNHLGHFLLTRLLLDQVEDSGRIVFVSSGTHYGLPRGFGFPGPRWAGPRTLAEGSNVDDSAKSGRIRYATSKLANIYMVHELARRVAGRDIGVYAYDPGLMPGTGLARDYSPRLQRAYQRLTPVILALPGARTAQRSGADLARLVTGPAHRSGAYIVGRKERRSSRESYDDARAAELWRVSEELVHAHTGNTQG